MAKNTEKTAEKSAPVAAPALSPTEIAAKLKLAAKAKDDDFKLVAASVANLWSPENEGDALVGVYTGRTDTAYLFAVEDGAEPVGVKTAHSLRAPLKGAVPGNVYKLVYTGTTDGERKQPQYKVFQLSA